MAPRRVQQTVKKGTAPARRRAPGRPTGDKPDQREALLDAAKLVFSQDGYTAASLRRIAQLAQVTPALPAYYFGDKAGLLEAVIDLRVAPLVQALHAAVVAAGAAPLAQLEAFVHAYTATAARNPWLPQLIVREVLNEQGALRDTFARRFAGGLAGMLRAAIERGQAEGRLRRDLEPRALAMSLISLCLFPFIARPLVSGALGIEVGEASASPLARHHWALFLAGAAEAT
jgi:TetR/AcrR family transcriptional regulator